MGAQAIDLSSGLVPAAGAPDLSAGLVPKSSPQQPEGFWHSLGAQLGITPEQAKAAVQDQNDHPLKNLARIALGPTANVIEGLYNQAKQTGSELMQAGKSAVAGNGADAIVHAVQAVPIVGPAINKAAEQAPLTPGSYLHQMGQVITDPGTMGTLVGGAAQAAPIVAGAVERTPVGKVISKVAAPVSEAISDTASAAKQYARPASSPAIVAPQEVQAQKIAQSILPPGGIKPELVKSIQAEAPAVVEYAQRTGNPLNTQAEGLKAAQGVAQEGLEHYQSQVLQPVAGRSVVLDPANTELGDKASIGDIDSRITKLNKLVNTAPANSAGAALDVLAKSKWTDELGYLRGKLYSSLEQTTGIPAADIQQLREGYGGEFSLANNLEAAQNARLTRTGQAAQGQQTIAGKVPTSLADIPAKALTAVKGGEQAIADRQFSSAMKGVQPQAPVRPLPPPIDTEALAANQQAAQQEFLQQHQLTQASQDSAAGRSQAVQTYREEQATGQQGLAQQEAIRQQQLDQAAQDASAQRGQQASGLRQGNVAATGGPAVWTTQGAQKVLAHIATDPSVSLKAADITQLSKTPAGTQLLIKASDLQPGSAAMKNLVQQMKTTLGATQ